MFKRISLIFTLMASLAFLISCKSSQHSYDEKYFLVSANIKIPYWETAGAGFSQAASQLGVRAEFVGPDTYDPQAERQERVDTCGFLADHAGAQHQPMRNDLGLLGRIAQDRQEKAGQTHRQGGPGFACAASETGSAGKTQVRQGFAIPPPRHQAVVESRQSCVGRFPCPSGIALFSTL